jgi:hypothetical protein
MPYLGIGDIIAQWAIIGVVVGSVLVATIVAIVWR